MGLTSAQLYKIVDNFKRQLADPPKIAGQSKLHINHMVKFTCHKGSLTGMYATHVWPHEDYFVAFYCQKCFQVGTIYF